MNNNFFHMIEQRGHLARLENCAAWTRNILLFLMVSSAVFVATCAYEAIPLVLVMVILSAFGIVCAQRIKSALSDFRMVIKSDMDNE